jgi:hypothetical protein
MKSSTKPSRWRSPSGILSPVEDIRVANLIGQRDVRTVNGIPPVRCEAIRKGLKTAALEARRLGASVHLPRIGCGLAAASRRG